MDIDWNAEVVDQLESHWQHQLRPRLNGLTDDEYFWQPVPGCWTLSRRGESKAPLSLGAGEYTMDYAANLEVIHHGAEISLLRDLYQWRGQWNARSATIQLGE